MAKKKKKRAAPKPPTVQRPKEFLDLIAPGAIQFNTDYFVFGNTYRTVMMLRGYPPTTEEQALGTHYGVVKTQLTDRNWTAWLEIPYIQYD